MTKILIHPAIPKVNSVPTPPAGFVILYPKSNGTWFVKRDDGSEIEFRTETNANNGLSKDNDGTITLGGTTQKGVLIVSDGTPQDFQVGDISQEFAKFRVVASEVDLDAPSFRGGGIETQDRPIPIRFLELSEFEEPTGYTANVDETTPADNHFASWGRILQEISAILGNIINDVTPSDTTTFSSNQILIRLGILDNIIDTKQDQLVSGTNIKTINGQSLLGGGDIPIVGGGGAETEPVADLATWAGKTDKNYVVGSESNLVTGNIPALDTTNYAIGSTITIYHNGVGSLRFLGGNYVGLEGNVLVPNAPTLIEIYLKGNGKGYVSMLRIDRINLPDPLTINGDVTLNTGQLIEPNYTINLDTIQWQISDDNVTFANIVGANAETYTTLAGQAGKYIRFQAIYVDNTGMFESQLVTSQSKLINSVVELVPSGYNMIDEVPDFGVADGIIRNRDGSGNTTYAVVDDGLNGFTGGYQRVSATTATGDIHFMGFNVITEHEPSGRLLPDTSYHVKIKYRASNTIRLTAGGGINFQSLFNNTGGTNITPHLNLPANTGDAIEIEFDILTNATQLSNLQIQFFNQVASPNFYEYQVSIMQN